MNKISKIQKHQTREKTSRGFVRLCRLELIVRRGLEVLPCKNSTARELCTCDMSLVL